MALSSLVRARGVGGGASLGVLALLSALACHNGAAGNRNMDAAIEMKPDLSEKLSPADVYCSPDAQGGGVCRKNFCGQPKSVAALGADELAALGTDELCTPGDVCVPDVAVAGGTALQLRCVGPLAPALPFGAACTKGAGTAMRCKSDALCISSADMPNAPFCSQLCRADDDCPTDAFCLEYRSDTLPNGSYVNLGFCTPKTKLAATACTAEGQCGADQGCLPYGARTGLQTCRKGAGPKAVGAACGADVECRSGECLDRAFKVAGGGRTFCSARCAKSSDCGADQRCTRRVLNNNGTPPYPFDDLVAGYCQSLFTPAGEAPCKADADCVGRMGTTCDTTHGLCYTAGAASGAACAVNEQCELNAVCTTSLDGGYCQTFGCAAGATTGADACPGADSVCSSRGAVDRPLSACYEGCTNANDCSRANERYACKAPPITPNATPSLCLYDQGA